METPVSLMEILIYLRDFFPKEKWYFDGHPITGGKIQLPDMWDGEYYLIEGSRRNDGIHVYGDADLLPEKSLPPRGAWIEIEISAADNKADIVAPPTGSVD